MSSIQASQGGGLVIHHICKCFPAACYMLCQGIGRLVAGLKYQKIQTILYRKSVSFFEGHLIAASRFHIIDRIMRKLYNFIHRGMFHNYQSRQQFCNTGRRGWNMDLLSEQHCLGIHIHNNPKISHNPCIRGPLWSPIGTESPYVKCHGTYHNKGCDFMDEFFQSHCSFSISAIMALHFLTAHPLRPVFSPYDLILSAHLQRFRWPAQR